MMNAIFFYRIGNFFYKKKLKIISVFIDSFIFFIYNSYIPSSCKIGKGTKFAYKGISVVIHSKCIIGDNCIIGVNSVVNKSFEQNSVIAGVPAIKLRDLTK